ncbi:MAG: winged helix DNA-binding protein [Candidatus Nanoarchaeia archaeon]|jgi:predicted transcriptional regulator
MGEEKRNNLVNLFLRNKPAFILMKIHACSSKCYASNIAKEVDCTYSHTVRIIQQLEKEGLLTFDKAGRIKTIILTKKGKDISENLKKLMTLFHLE